MSSIDSFTLTLTSSNASTYLSGTVAVAGGGSGHVNSSLTSAGTYKKGDSGFIANPNSEKGGYIRIKVLSIYLNYINIKYKGDTIYEKPISDFESLSDGVKLLTDECLCEDDIKVDIIEKLYS